MTLDINVNKGVDKMDVDDDTKEHKVQCTDFCFFDRVLPFGKKDFYIGYINNNGEDAFTRIYTEPQEDPVDRTLMNEVLDNSVYIERGVGKERDWYYISLGIYVIPSNKDLDEAKAYDFDYVGHYEYPIRAAMTTEGLEDLIDAVYKFLARACASRTTFKEDIHEKLKRN